MKPGLRWLYTLTLASILLLPSWQTEKNQVATTFGQSWTAVEIADEPLRSDFTLEGESARHHKELKEQQRQQKQALPILLHLLASFEVIAPEPILLGELLEVTPAGVADVAYARQLTRGPPALG